MVVGTSLLLNRFDCNAMPGVKNYKEEVCDGGKQ
jgi:hypothetical protein